MAEFRIIRDTSHELQSMYRKVVGEDHKNFPELNLLRFLFTWREGKPEWSKDNQVIMAQVKKLPPRERDVYLFDIELRVWYDGYQEMNHKQKRRTIWHELRHVQVDLDEDFKPTLDSENRIRFHLAPHDIVIRTFADEVEKFGVNPQDKHPIQLLNHHLRKLNTEKGDTHKKSSLRRRKVRTR